MKESEKKALVEALVFAAAEPVSARKIAAAVDEITSEEAKVLLQELAASCLGENRGIYIREVAGGYQMISKPDYAHWIRELNQDRKAARLSRAALEVLAIVAYRQPITQPEIADVRGIMSDAPLKTLLGRKLLRMQGRKNVVGRPILYGTTREFLLQFGLRDLKDLPDMDEFEQFIAAEETGPLSEEGDQPPLEELENEGEKNTSEDSPEESGGEE
jgi:segregation and condensation protein B